MSDFTAVGQFVVKIVSEKDIRLMRDENRMIRLTISSEDYEEIIFGLETVISDRCVGERERKQTQGVIDRVEASKYVLEKTEEKTDE